MSLSKFESMLKTNSIYFFDLVEFEEIILYYLDIGKHSLAKNAVKLGLEQHPTSVDLKLLQVEIYIFEDKLDKASNALKKIEILEPNNEEVHIQKAAIQTKRGAHTKAIENLKIALGFAEDKADVWSLLGMEYLYLDDFDNARLNFEKCVVVDVEDYSALYNIVYCFDMEKKHEQAIIFLEAYIDVNPYSEIAWHQLGKQYFVLENYIKALRSFDYAVLIDDLFIGGYVEKAKTLEELGRFEEAIENYSVTLDLDDPTAFVYTRIGKCYQKMNKGDAAISFYKKAVQEDPLLDKSWVLLTNLFYEQKNYRKALYYVSKALAIDEDNSLYWRKYTDINLKLSFFEEAAKGLKKCLSLDDVKLEVYVGLSDILLFLGDYNEALENLLAARGVHKNFADIEYRVAGLWMMLGNEKQGMDHLIYAMKVDFNSHVIVEELFPLVFDNLKVQKLLSNFKKATE
jgi:tetratricopeptide (TPR) repeat protein